MKKLILIPILFLACYVNAQYTIVKPSQLPAASTINVSDLFIINQGVTTKKVTMSVLSEVLKDTFPTRAELADTAAAIRADFPTGGGGFASDGVYMDEDTTKLGGNVYNTIIGDPSHNYIQYADDGSSKYLLLSSQGVNNYTEVFIDSLSAQYGSSVDTAQFNDNSIVPKNMMKREIAAAQRWADISGGISYGNEVTVGSLAGTGTRNIGADANGKLVELAATGGEIMKASATFTSSELLNGGSHTIIPTQSTGKMAIVLHAVAQYNFVTTPYVSNEFYLAYRYVGQTEYYPSYQLDGGQYFLASTASKMVNVIFYEQPTTNEFKTPTNAGIQVWNLTGGVFDGDGTLTITIYYTVIDI